MLWLWKLLRLVQIGKPRAKLVFYPSQYQCLSLNFNEYNYFLFQLFDSSGPLKLTLIVSVLFHICIIAFSMTVLLKKKCYTRTYVQRPSIISIFTANTSFECDLPYFADATIKVVYTEASNSSQHGTQVAGRMPVPTTRLLICNSKCHWVPITGTANSCALPPRGPITVWQKRAAGATQEFAR